MPVRLPLIKQKITCQISDDIASRGDAVDQRIACDGRWRGEDERNGETQDRRAQHHEQNDQQAIGGTRHQTDVSRADQAGAVGIGPISQLRRRA